ncbi:MAG: hypothetical protein OXE79_06935 [Acidimicrobiaceae bacterium]|nr:hypothetical protein [Acidimicrobiaceae bacterium]
MTITAAGSYGAATGARTVSVPTSGSVTLTVATTDDDLDALDGSVTATLVNGTGYGLDSNASSATVAVTDNDTPEISIAATGGDITEGETAVFTVTADPAPAAALAVSFTVNQLGDFGIDGRTRTLTIPTTGSATLNVNTQNDNTDEPDGRIEATLLAGTGYILDSNARSARVSVADDDTPTPVVSITAGGDVTEGGSAVFTLTAVPAPAAQFDVTVTVAVAGDYGVTAGSRTVTIPTSGTATLTLATTDDNTDEANGSVTATLVDGAAYDLDTTTTATINIADNDNPTPATPVVSITAGGDVTEGGSAVFTLVAVPAPAAQFDVTVTVATTGDYGVTAGSRTVTIPTSGTATLTLATTDDNTDEANGSVTATLVDGAAYDLGSTVTATVNVADNETPAVTITSAGDVTEGGNAVFTLVADPAPHASLDVTVTVAVAGSYGVTAGSRTVTIPTSGTATLTLATTDDSTDEANGSVTATLVDGAAYDLDTTTSATVAVADDDGTTPTVSAQLISDVRGYAAETENGDDHVNRWKRVLLAFGESVPGFTGTAMTAAEAQTFAAKGWSRWDPVITALRSVEAGTATPPATPVVSIAAGGDVTEGGSAVFTLTAVPAPATQFDVTVTIATTGSYGVTTGSRTVTIPTGGTATLTLATTDDSTDELNGSVTVTLVDGAAYDIASTATATVNIADNDDPAPATPVVSIAAGGDVTEGGSAVFTLTAVPAPAAQLDVTVTIATTGDYGVTTGSRTVTIPTSGTATLTLATSNDSVDEANGSVTATLVDGAAYDLDTTTSATVAVADNETPAVSVTSAGDVIEGGDAVFTLVADPAPHASLDVAVTVTTTGDFGVAAGSRTVTIPTSGTATLTLATTDDSTDETNGTITATLVDGTAYDLDSASSATVAVADDDAPAGSCTVTAPSDDLIQRVRGYHDLNRPKPGYNQNWLRVLIAFGAETSGTLEPFTAAEARNGEQVWDGWTPIRQELERLEQETAQCATPVVSIAAGGDVTEGGSAVFTLTAAPPPATQLDVTVTVAATGDYGVTAGSRTVTIPTGGTATLTLATTDDNSDEANGTVTATLVDGAAYDVASTATATVNIADDDNPPPVVSAQLISDVRGYAAETQNGDDHVNRWKRVLLAFGETVPGFTGTAMTAAEAQTYAAKGWTRWDPIVTALQTIEAGTTTPPPTPPPTPVVSIAAAGDITEGGNAVFTLTATPAPAAQFNVTVTITTTGSYGVTTGTRTVTIPTGGTATLTLATTNDNTDEPNGSVTATLVDGSAYDLDTTTTATINIADNDNPTPATPVVSIAAGGNITEGANAVFTLTATPAPSAQFDVTVTITTTGSYGITTGTRTVTIPTSGTATLTLATTNDNTDEPNGSVTATLVDGSAYDLDTTTTATINIADNDNPTPATPVVSIAAGGNITEGANAVFTLTATPAPSAQFDVTVTITTTGSYGITAGTRTVTIPTSGTATLTLATTNDNTDEANGTITATLVDGAAYDLDTTTTATVNIADNETPAVSITSAGDVTEGGNAVFTLVADPVPHASLDVTVTIATSGSYGVTAGTRTVTIPTSGTATLTLATTDDSTDEANGTITATLVDGAAYDLGLASSATVAVSDNDDTTTVLISVNDGSGDEGDQADFTVTLSQAAPHRVTVRWAARWGGAGRTALTGEFWRMSGTMVFQPGETTKSGFTFLDDDNQREGDEVFLIQLSQPTGATIERGTATMTIIDND